MKILMITDNDPAGMAIAFTNAINRYTEHTCRLISKSERYGFAYEKDIHLPDIHDDDFGEIEQLLSDADIFHFHMLTDENSHLGPLVIRDYIKGKKVLHHEHGHPDYLVNARQYNEKYQRLGRRMIVATPDLLQVAPQAVWVPNLVPLDDVHYQPRYDDTLPNMPIRICQAPTRKFDKHTREFVEVLLNLNREYPGVEQLIIERIPHIECLKIKRQCHIIFDHMRGWFGISSLESMAHGKPVLAGLNEWNINHIKKFTQCEDIPWIVVKTPYELHISLSNLISNQSLRIEKGIYSRKFMEKYWNEKNVLRVLEHIYNNNM